MGIISTALSAFNFKVRASQARPRTEYLIQTEMKTSKKSIKFVVFRIVGGRS